jgi:hypothetical protein
MKAMRKLNLLGANVSDESVDVLTGMPRLMELNLYRSRLTNSGLSRLTALKSLADLDLRYSRVTPTALQSFRAALPKCKIDFVGATAAHAKPATKPAGTSESHWRMGPVPRWQG